MQQMVIDQSPEDSFPEILAQLVLEPLGMNQSTYQQPLTGEQLLRAATGYLPDGSMTTGKRHTYPEMAAAGLWTTAEDLALFAIELGLSHQGQSNKVLSQSMATHMVSPFIEDFVGMGIFIEQKGQETYLGHGGWDEGFSSELLFHKSKGYGVVVLTNSNHPDFIAELIRSVAQTYQWDEYLPPIYEDQPVPEDELAHISGRYFFSADNLIEVYEEQGQLYLKYLRDDPVALFKVTDTTYVRRHLSRTIQFKEEPETGKLHLVFSPENEEEPTFDHPLMTEDMQVPYEKLMAGAYDEALEEYQKLKEQDPDSRDISEGHLNRLGYQLMGDKQLEVAIQLFTINTILYPEAFNTYDSLAEAYMNNGSKDLAIINYQKSLDLNQDNQNAKDMLAKLGDQS